MLKWYRLIGHYKWTPWTPIASLQDKADALVKGCIVCTFERSLECKAAGSQFTLHQAGEDALDLLAGLTVFDPRKRLTVSQALQHRYFRTSPLPTQTHLLPKPPMTAHNPLQYHQQVFLNLQVS